VIKKPPSGCTIDAPVDTEDSDDAEGGGNKNKPDRRRMERTSQRIKWRLKV
jgi:hypothetical protein